MSEVSYFFPYLSIASAMTNLNNAQKHANDITNKPIDDKISAFCVYANASSKNSIPRTKNTRDEIISLNVSPKRPLRFLFIRSAFQIH